MQEAAKTPDVFRFGPFELSVETGELRKNGVRLPVAGQPIRVLTLLIEAPESLVTRQELQRQIWPGSSYGNFEAGLNAAVARLRTYLDDSATEPKYIETVPGRGYRFIAAVQSSERVEDTKPSSRPSWWKRRTTVIVDPIRKSRRRLVVSWLVTSALVAIALVAVSFYWHSRWPLSPFSAKEWILAGSQPKSYEAGTDAQEVFNGRPSACLRSKEPVGDGFGTLMQSFQAGEYQGKRVRLRAFTKSVGIEDWAGLWMRVDKGTGPALAFDNMQDRPIKGTTSWQRHDVVLDVPSDADDIAFGVLLAGTGKIWLNGIEFEVVGSDVPTTGVKPKLKLGDKPKLGFEK